MAKYRITSPDGATFEVSAPDDATPDQVQAYARQQFASMKPAGPVGDASGGGKLMGAAMGLTDMPVAAGQLLQNTPGISDGLNLLRRGIRGGLSAAGATDAAGLFGDVSPEQFNAAVGQREKQYEADRTAAGRGGFDWSRLVGNVANPINLALPGSAAIKSATTAAQLAKAGATAGASSGVLQPVADAGGNFWTEKAKQGAAGAAAGAVLTPVAAKGMTAAATGAKRVMESMAPRVTVVGGGLTRADMDAAVGHVLQSQGMRLEEAPRVILDSVRRQISEAVAGGQKLSPEMALRQANAEALGLTGDAALTAGQMSRDPMKFAQERNLSGIVIQTPQGQGNPLATRFANQNKRLMSLFDEANGAADRVSGGEQILGALQEANQRADQAVRDAYAAFRTSTGRELDVPLQGLARDYRATLKEFDDAIPSAVRKKFDELLTPKQGGGHNHGTPKPPPRQIVDESGKVLINLDAPAPRTLSLEDAERLIKTINSNTDPMNRPAYRALGELRSALQRSITEAADTSATGAGAEAAMLAKEARRTAAGVFQARRDAPALQAALEDKAPDRFIQQFIMNAPTREVESMAGYLRQDPAAWGQARAQMLDHLKRAAFGENLAGDKTISPERFAAALRMIGPQKLRIFFGEDEAVRLQLAGKLAAEINSVPAGATNAVNYSNTGSAVFNLLQKLGESAAARRIPGVRALSNQAGEIANERAMGQALQGAPAATKPQTQLSPEALQAIRRLFLPAAVGGGAAAGGAF